MILIAESGSTKTNWLSSEKQLYQTIGFNPLFHTTDSIYTELQKHEDLKSARAGFTKVFFYGASCSSADRNKIVEDALRKFFTSAEVIKVDHDLKAAAVATYNGKPGIACILGTGSNSCLYDGNEITEVVPALGYVLGDEGSAAHLGKKLIAQYLYNELPPATMKLMKEVHGLEKEAIITRVYKQPFANVYLAAFAKILSESPDKEEMNKIAEEGFTAFFRHHVCCYKNYAEYPVHFVGSVAFFHTDVLKKVASNFGCIVGVIDREPVYRLLTYHLKQEGKNEGNNS